MQQELPSWPERLYTVLKTLDIRQVAYVPDAGHAKLIDLCAADTTMTTVSVTTEEEGIAMLAGAWLGGQRGAMLMQSSGVGNCINMLSLQYECRIPLFMLVTMRGQWAEFNPWQIAMGQGTRQSLETMGVIVSDVETPDDAVATAESAGRLAFQTGRATAVLLGQRLIGAKVFGDKKK
jgi:sulfopyruvate decarboxylase alpha subunit